MLEAAAMNTWDRVLGKIEAKVNTRSFSTWFRPTQQLHEDAATLSVRVPNSWFVEWLNTNYLALIQDALKEARKPYLFGPILDSTGVTRSKWLLAPQQTEDRDGPEGRFESLHRKLSLGKFGGIREKPSNSSGLTMAGRLGSGTIECNPRQRHRS